jgi:hypothetical protein
MLQRLPSRKAIVGCGALLHVLLACALPTSHGRVCDVFKDCGARPPPFLSSDALTACARVCDTLHFPENARLLVSSVDLSNTTGLTLLFDANAVINTTTDISRWPIAPFFPPMGNTTCFRAVFFGRNVTDFRLLAPPSAVVDGSGAFWQPLRPTLPHQAPKLFELVDARNISVIGGTFANSANWHWHVVFASDVVFLNVTVLGNRSWGGTDGIDPHSVSNVLIDGAHIDVGDDAIAVTSGEHDVTKRLVPTVNVTVRNSFLVSRNFAIGSSVAGNVSEVLVEDTRIGDAFGSAPWAVKIKTHCPNGGNVENVTFRRLQLGHIRPNAYQQPHGGMALSMYMNYGSSHLCDANDPTPAPTVITNISFIDIVGLSAVWAARPLNGSTHRNITGLFFRNVSFGPTSDPQPWDCLGVEGTRVEGVVTPPLPKSCGL